MDAEPQELISELPGATSFVVVATLLVCMAVVPAAFRFAATRARRAA